MITPEWAIGLMLCLPLLCSLVVWLLGKQPNARDAAAVGIGLVTAALSIQLAMVVAEGVRPELKLLTIVPGIALGFRVEPLGMIYALVAACLWPVTTLYAVGYMRGHHEKNQTRFFACFPLAIFAALGIAYAQNLFTLFVFYEILTFSTYPLVAHHQNEKAKKAGRVYLGILVTTSVCFLLLAIAWTYHLTGSTEFVPGGILSSALDETDHATVSVLLLLFAFGAGKAALMPFHRWLPNAMVAPTPVSALLHAVAVVKAGVFTIVKVVVYIFGLDLLSSSSGNEWLMFIAAFTIIVSSLIAFTKDNLKERLAYSTISQLSYIVLGAALASELSVIGSGMHIAMHATSKITLFFCAGAIIVSAHKTKVSELDGLAKVMPITMAAFAIGTMGIIGVPPTGGSWSKWYLALGALEAGHTPYMFVFMISSLLNVGYLVPVSMRAFFKPSRTHAHGAHIKENWQMTVPLCITALLTVAFFFFGEFVADFLRVIVGNS